MSYDSHKKSMSTELYVITSALDAGDVQPAIR